METTSRRCWVSTISLDHVQHGVEGGFTQAGHGSDTRLRRLARGDGIVFYSPRASLGAGRPLQQLTALGTIADDEPYQVEVPAEVPAEGAVGGADEGADEGAGGGGTWRPWRRRVDFEQVTPVPIRPLLPLVGFIGDEQRWGMAFRRGLFEVPPGDFGVLAGALRDAAWVPDEYSSSGRSAR